MNKLNSILIEIKKKRNYHFLRKISEVLEIDFTDYIDQILEKESERIVKMLNRILLERGLTKEEIEELTKK